MTYRDVVVVGGGLAGLAAATALAGAGVRVTLLEWRPYWGGRAYSYQHPTLRETIDSQHVVLGCCTNIVSLLTTAQAADLIRWYDDLLFLEPGGRRSVLRSGELPAPLQRAFSMLRAPMLSFRDKVAIGRGLTEFLRGYPTDDGESAASWMKRTRQTERARQHFWEPVILATLNDSAERCSLKYAGKVFHEAFLRSPEAGRVGVPVVPLSELFGRVAEHLTTTGAVMKGRSSVRRLTQDNAGWVLTIAEGETIRTDAVVLATDVKSALTLLSGLPDASSVAEKASAMTVAPITTAHFWFDREVVTDDQAALLDTRIQWMFCKSRIRQHAREQGCYVELVISGSFAELAMSREDILESALRELTLFYPRVAEARLLKSAVLKEARATFSVAPGMDRVRPKQQTPWPGLFLAGDWTATAWPSTMEGAVRSGRLAAGEVLGNRERFLSAELPATGLMRWLSRQD